MMRIQTFKSNWSSNGFSDNVKSMFLGKLHLKYVKKTNSVLTLVCAVASLRLISLEAVGPLSLGSSHFKKARRVASSYIYWSLKKILSIYNDSYPICIQENTPSRPSEISEKNWSTWAMPFLTSIFLIKS